MFFFVFFCFFLFFLFFVFPTFFVLVFPPVDDDNGSTSTKGSGVFWSSCVIPEISLAGPEGGEGLANPVFINGVLLLFGPVSVTAAPSTDVELMTGSAAGSAAGSVAGSAAGSVAGSAAGSVAVTAAVSGFCTTFSIGSGRIPFTIGLILLQGPSCFCKAPKSLFISSPPFELILVVNSPVLRLTDNFIL